MRARSGRGFTLLELVVAVGLMVIMLGVLGFIFQQSATAVSGSSNAVGTIHQTRLFESRFGKDIGNTIRAILETDAGRAIRAFRVGESGSDLIAEEGGRQIMFITQTRFRGIDDIWLVRYYYEPVTRDYGAIKRMVRAERVERDEASPKGDGRGRSAWKPYNINDTSVWNLDSLDTYNPDEDPEMQVETIIEPVRLLRDANGQELPVFQAVDPDGKLAEPLRSRLPASVKVSLMFMNSRRAEGFTLPMQYSFPIHQGD